MVLNHRGWGQQRSRRVTLGYDLGRGASGSMTMTLEGAPVVVAPRKSAPSWLRLGRGVVVGLALVLIVLLARWSGLLQGKVALAVFALALLAVPTSRQLARRILLGVCLSFGWIPLLWWWPLPVGGLGRATLLTALMVGGVGAWAGAGQDPLTRCRRIVPKLAVIDSYPLVLTALSAWALRPWLQPKSGASSLSMLMDGWDHSAHFAMVHQIRLAGVTVDMAAPPASGGVWQFSSYPQSFHAVTATVVELLTGPRVGDLGTELSVFCQAIAVVSMCLVAVVMAGLCALPSLRRRPLLALPLATFAAAVMIFGPGSSAIQDGFVNFNFACALVVAVAFLVVPMARVVTPLHLAAVGGALVGIANGWILLLVLAAPVTLVGLLPVRPSRWSSSRRGWTLSIIVAVLVLVGVLRAAIVVARVPVDNVLLLNGGILPPDVGITVLGVLVCGTFAFVVGRAPHGAPAVSLAGPKARVRGLVSLPLVAALGAASLAALQLSHGDKLTYYFLKYLLGVEIVALVVLTIPLAFLLVHWFPARPRSAGAPRAWHQRVWTARAPALVSLALALAATQAFGFAAPNLTATGLPPTAPGALHRVGEQDRSEYPPSATSIIETAPRLHQAHPRQTIIYLSFPSDQRVDPLIAAQWYFALTGTWVRADNELASKISFDRGSAIPNDFRTTDVVASAQRILASRPDAYVAVGAEQLHTIRMLMPPTVDADHVIAW